MRRKQQDATDGGGGRMGGLMNTIKKSTRNFRMAMETEKQQNKNEKIDMLDAVVECDEVEAENEEEDEESELLDSPRVRAQSGNSTGSMKKLDSPEQIPIKPIHSVNIERLLHIGILEKSGPTSMIWYPWLARLVMFTTKGVQYFSIPYVELSDVKKGNKSSVSKGFKSPQSARGSVTSVEVKVQNLIKSDIDELLEFRMSMMQLSDCGLGMVGRILHDKGYKLKGEIRFSAVLGVTVDVNKKTLHVDFATASRVYHFRTQQLSEKGSIDTALTIVASQLQEDDEHTDDVTEHDSDALMNVAGQTGGTGGMGLDGVSISPRDNSVRESSASLFRITYTDAARSTTEHNTINTITQPNPISISVPKSKKPFEPMATGEVQDSADIELAMMEQAHKPNTNTTGTSTTRAKRASVAPVAISDDQLISLLDTEKLVQLAHDMSPPSPRLLYIGILEKTGGSLFSSGWLTRLVVISTLSVEYYSIPYVEEAGGLDLAKESDRQKSIQDYTECTQLRAAMIKYPESGYHLVKNLLEERLYKKKGDVAFNIIDGFSVQVNNKNVLIFDIPTTQK